MSFWKNKYSFAVLIAGVTALLFMLFAYIQVFELWHLKLADYLYGNHATSEDIIMVKIDDDTISDQTGIGHIDSWERHIYAHALNNISKYNPKAIVFDIFFQGAKTDAGDDRLLKSFANASAPVILGYPVYRDYIQSSVSYNLPYAPFISEINTGLGAANTATDEDDIVRKYDLGFFDEYKELYRPSLALSTILALFSADAQPSSSYNSYESFISYFKKQSELDILDKDMSIINNFANNSPDNKYPNVSLISVFNDEYPDSFDPSTFKDKIVIIGVYTDYLGDSYETPVGQLYGMEIHANAIQTILEQRFLRNMTLPEQSILIILFCFAGAFVFMLTKIRWSLVVLVVVPVVYTLLTPVAFANGVIPDMVHPYLALPTVFVASYMYRYFTEFKEKSVLKGAFSKYVSPEIVKSISEHPENLKLGGQQRKITVLFTDIVGFTSISEVLKPESLVALLNEYFDAMETVIKSEGGTLDKFEGDAIMAFFGAPLPQEDHAIRACRCAVKMRQRLSELNIKWMSDEPLPGGEKKPQIDFRCGISTGEVIVGNIGASDRFNYTAIGDTVNLASRLESANKKYDTRIMISDSTLNDIDILFWVRELDIIKVVGKKKPTVIYELLGLKIATPKEAVILLQAYEKGMEFYHARRFAEGINHFKEILKSYPNDGPSKIYLQRCEVLKDYPPAKDWDFVFEMKTK